MAYTRTLRLHTDQGVLKDWVEASRFVRQLRRLRANWITVTPEAFKGFVTVESADDGNLVQSKCAMVKLPTGEDPWIIVSAPIDHNTETEDLGAFFKGSIPTGTTHGFLVFQLPSGDDIIRDVIPCAAVLLDASEANLGGFHPDSPVFVDKHGDLVTLIAQAGIRVLTSSARGAVEC